MSFFCFEAGKISSRSTGTPRETRNARRIRDRIQSGGCNGGGVTSCDHSDAERDDRNTEESIESGGSGRGLAPVGGNNADIYGSVLENTSFKSISSRFGVGWWWDLVLANVQA